MRTTILNICVAMEGRTNRYSEKISILLYVVGSLLEVVGPPAILIDLGVVSCLTKPHGDVTRHSLCK